MLQSAPRTSPNTVTTQGHVKRTVQAFNKLEPETLSGLLEDPDSLAQGEREE